jgi:hypothetical protein
MNVKEYCLERNMLKGGRKSEGDMIEGEYESEYDQSILRAL